MKTVVAFTNNKVQVICGDGTQSGVTVSRVLDVDFEMNCVLSGVITDPEVFAAGIRNAWQKYGLPKKGVVLSLDGNNIKTKKASVPKVNRDKTLDIAAMEFKEIEVFTNPIFSFVTLAEDQAAREIMAVGGEFEFVQSLVEVFSAQGIKVESVVSTRCAMIKLMGLLEFVRGKSCMIQTMDEETLTTVLVENGQFVNISTARVFSEHGSQAFGLEVARNVSQLSQFQSSQRSQNLASEVYMAGFRQEDLQVAKEQIELLAMQVSLFDPGQRLHMSEGITGRLFLHAGALVLGVNEGNLFVSYKEHLKNTKKRDKQLLKILPILILVAIFTAVGSSMVIANQQKERQVMELTNFINDPANVAINKEYQEKLLESGALNARINVTDDIKKAIESYPLATSELNRVIVSCGSGIALVNVTNYSAETGYLHFNAIGADATKINEFVKALTETGIFYGVSYSGYNIIDDVGGYMVNVSCILSPEAGK